MIIMDLPGFQGRSRETMQVSAIKGLVMADSLILVLGKMQLIVGKEMDSRGHFLSGSAHPSFGLGPVGKG